MASILGLNFGHDGAAAIVVDGRLVSAISHERLSRVKKAAGVSAAMITYVLEAAGLSLDSIDVVGFSSYLYSPDNEIKLFTKNGEEVRRHAIDLFGGDTHTECMVQIANRRIPAFLIQHHIAHCASAFYTSPFERAACFSVDASMRHPEACSLFAYGDGSSLHYLHCPGVMIGNAYSTFTEKLGIGPGLTKAGSTMGLAPYGVAAPWAASEWQEWGRSYYERRFQPADHLFIEQMWSRFSGLPPHLSFTREQSDSKAAMDIAASLQRVFEQSLLSFARKLHAESAPFSGNNLCLAGGSFLNSETNMLLLRHSGFERVHLFPGCGDDGTAVGAALFVAHQLMKLPRANYRAAEIAYLGKRYPIPGDLARFGRTAPYDPAAVARDIAGGKVIAFFQGGSEFGPRALGNRSLLADPRNRGMRDHLNLKVKRREWYRPFAPAVLAEEAARWFDVENESPFMLLIADAKNRDAIASAVHVDGSARLQTVRREDNPRFHELIGAFAKESGVPVLINTSLNGNGEPLVETPQDALRLFETAEIDELVFADESGGAVVTKR